MTSDALRKEVWDARLDAHAQSRYFHDLASQTDLISKVIMCVSILASSGSIVAWFTSNATEFVPILALVSTVLGSVNLIFKFGYTAADMRIAAKASLDRQDVWDALWGRIEDGEEVSRDVVAREKERDRKIDTTRYRFSEKAAIKAQREAHRALGLPPPGLQKRDPLLPAEAS